MTDKSPETRTDARGTQRVGYVAWRIARPFLLAYLVVVLLMMLQETSLVYPAPPPDDGDWQPVGLGHEEVWFTSADGTKLYGWFVPHRQPRRVLLYCHGNGEHLGYNADLAAHLREVLDASVFIFDYRGYGRSEGRPSESGCIADGLAAQRWLAERVGVETSDTVLMGRSLGAAVAVGVAAEQDARALVLENAFSRMTDVAAYHYPWLPVRLVMRNRYDCITRIRQYRGPLVQSHGPGDDIVPIKFGRELFDAAPSTQKRFIEFSAGGHNDRPPVDYYDQIAAFLDEIAPPAEAETPPPAGHAPP